ncbi:hypothetical protein ACUYOF_07760 [Photobacterium ganghwense]|uniref:hypothetical protein n=1 Tax=Photobacterium ganghwense TaxID=320778 RepID=UPI0040560191
MKRIALPFMLIMPSVSIANHIYYPNSANVYVPEYQSVIREPSQESNSDSRLIPPKSSKLTKDESDRCIIYYLKFKEHLANCSSSNALVSDEEKIEQFLNERKADKEGFSGFSISNLSGGTISVELLRYNIWYSSNSKDVIPLYLAFNKTTTGPVLPKDLKQYITSIDSGLINVFISDRKNMIADNDENAGFCEWTITDNGACGWAYQIGLKAFDVSEGKSQDLAFGSVISAGFVSVFPITKEARKNSNPIGDDAGFMSLSIMTGGGYIDNETRAFLSQDNKTPESLFGLINIQAKFVIYNELSLSFKYLTSSDKNLDNDTFATTIDFNY